MKFRIALAVILSGCVLSLGADQVRGVFAVVLYQHAYTQPVGSGAASANISINCGGASFSQCGWENKHNGTLTSGWFDNLQAGNISPSFPGSQNYLRGCSTTWTAAEWTGSRRCSAPTCRCSCKRVMDSSDWGPTEPQCKCSPWVERLWGSIQQVSP